MNTEPLEDRRSLPSEAQVRATSAPLVSVICTARNASATIARTIESVRRQTLSAWEMVIVDDGSTDATAEVVRGYAEIDSRIRLIPTAGIGRGRALNLAVAHARADFVANLDADDESHPQRLELQRAALARLPSPVLLSTDVIYVGAEQEPNVGQRRYAIEACRLVDVTRLLAAGNPISHSSVMLRKRDLCMAGGYAEALPSQFDYELWVRMAERGFRMIQLDAPLTANRAHAGQSFQRRRRFAYLYHSMRMQSRAIAACGVSRGYYALILARFVFGMLPLALRRTLKSRFSALAPRGDTPIPAPAGGRSDPALATAPQPALEGPARAADSSL